MSAEPGAAESVSRGCEASDVADAPQPASAATSPTDDVVTNQHSLKIGRRTLKYTATTGRIVLREEEHKDGSFSGNQPRAELSFTAYVVDGIDSAKRPVTRPVEGGKPGEYHGYQRDIELVGEFVRLWAAVPAIIDGLRRKGYTIVTVSQLIGSPLRGVATRAGDLSRPSGAAAVM